ncbi:hypothetical protein VOLCADRAFT_104954 [Volvox carteri f. nagariensis]|uniref:AAA+ ATPase domain-containing protein n=1 Tax=Volvox carteri f. nagariensis TaxID=3068 RepID=D8TXE1_VOLCA|nr:uncharacterized protein VOLCADRAFT_104954 [Volvox carteri f. nagariensis]EFJ47993.1 hypothetical protein VOLCADRAFT_104954 [Volvox carteri f. nagariensis]|eukprot:XP_002951099.1 hypothetical protein VOLCADRAFT_104954 [Volvox carteri f. nagariensis]
MNLGQVDAATVRTSPSPIGRSLQRPQHPAAPWPPLIRSSTWRLVGKKCSSATTNAEFGRRRRPGHIALAAAASPAEGSRLAAGTDIPQHQQQQQQHALSQQSFKLDEDAALLSNFHRLDVASRSSGVVSEPGNVFSERFITDSRELHLVARMARSVLECAQALAIRHGNAMPRPFRYLPCSLSFHPPYYVVLCRTCFPQAMSAGRPVDLPRPHPKFTQQDLERLASSSETTGPRLDDLVLEHVERLTDQPVDLSLRASQQQAEVRRRRLEAGQALGALGEQQQQGEEVDEAAVEANRARISHDGVTGWPGWRAVVSYRGSVRHWVDMPEEGELVQLEDQMLETLAIVTLTFACIYIPFTSSCINPHWFVSPPADLTDLGYRHVFAQLYQAYEARYPADLVAAIYSSGGRARRELAAVAAEAGGLPHETPALRHLDVSYHSTGNPVQDPVTAWFIRPTLDGIKQALRDIRTLEEDPGAAMEFARSKSEARKEGLTGVEFADVAGLGPILSEVVEVVEFLKDPQTFSKLGARPPKGILLEGDPGTGKTLLAKALAGEAMVPFYQMSGTEFTEGIVGLGAARVRDLFKRARATAPCVIFVDEIDALGLRRAENDSAKTNEEREQTLNQLLTEMDGFTPDTGVVFLGATNRADLLDPALMRPGRFDRKIRMPKPDTEGRYEILKLHLRNKQLAPDVDLLQLARDLPGLVGADLANIVNEAAMTAVRDGGRSVLTAKDMYAGVDRFTQVVSTDAMDGFADWPTVSEDFRFDAPSPSDVTWHRYTDEVRRVIKSCSEDVLAILEERREAMWAGIKALADQKELLGPELRDIFDQHPPRTLSEEERPKLSMTIYTDGENNKWPYGIEWLNDAYPVPYWVRKAEAEEKEGRQREEGSRREIAAAGASDFVPFYLSFQRLKC